MGYHTGLSQLRDYGTPGYLASMETLAEIAGVPVTITVVKICRNEHRPYAIFEAVDETGFKHNVLTTCFFIVDKLSDAVLSQALPVEATFNIVGGFWRVV